MSTTRLGTARVGLDTTVKALAFSPDGKSLMAAGATGEVAELMVPDLSRVRTIVHRGASLATDEVRWIDAYTFALVDSLGRTSFRTTGRGAFATLEARVWVSLPGRADVVRTATCGKGFLANQVSVIDRDLRSPAAPPIEREVAVVVASGPIHAYGLARGALAVATAAEVEVYRIPGGGRVFDLQVVADLVVFTPCGSLVIVARDGTVWVDGHRRGKLRPGRAALSPDARHVTTLGSDSVLDLVAGVARPALPADATAVAFSWDGKLAAVGRADGTLDLHELRSGSCVGPRREPAITSVAFSPDGVTLATGRADGVIELRDANEPARVLRSLARHDAPVVALALAPDVTLIASSGRDRRVCVGPLVEGEVTVLEADRHHVGALAWSPDGERLALTGPAAVFSRSTSSHSFLGETRRAPSLARSVSFSSDGTRLALVLVDGGVDLWDVRRNRRAKRVLPAGSGARAVSYSLDGRWLAIALEESVELRDAATLAPERTLTVAVASLLAFSWDGSALAVASDVVRVVDPSSGAELLRVFDHEGGVLSLAFSPDGGRLATAGPEGTVLVTLLARELSS
jgi:WD40 repeat protein